VVGNGFPRHWNLRDHMKRVHNCSPEPLDSDQPVRGTKKRKKSDASEALSKKRTPLTSPAAEKVAPVAVSLEEQFHQHRRQLMDSIQHLESPTDPAAKQKLFESFNILKDMASTSQRIAAPRMGRTTSQQSG